MEIHSAVFETAADTLGVDEGKLTRQERREAASSHLRSLAARVQAPEGVENLVNEGPQRKSFMVELGCVLVHLCLIAGDNNITLDDCLQAWSDNYKEKKSNDKR